MIDTLLSAEWQDQLLSFNKLIVGYSGGLDSTVLLHTLALHPKLRNKIVAVHVNHGLSVNALAWQQHCARYCSLHEISFISHQVKLERLANREERARIARYNVFSSMLTEQDCLVLAHHRNDQAETLLLHLFRGAGIDGLAAMHAQTHLGSAKIVRPFLNYSVEMLFTYAKKWQLAWIEDESNEDRSYSRNFIRHEIIPLLAQKWPSITTNLAQTAAHCQQAQHNLNELADIDLRENNKAVLPLGPINHLSEARIMNVLRFWLKKNQVLMPSTSIFERIFNELILSRAGLAQVSFAHIRIYRYHHALHLCKTSGPIIEHPMEWSNFPAPITWGEDILSTQRTIGGLVIPLNAKIVIAKRRGGEQFFWHGQHKQLKKLFQQWNIPPWLRENVPLIYVNDELSVIVGYAISDLFYSPSSAAWTIQLINK